MRKADSAGKLCPQLKLDLWHNGLEPIQPQAVRLSMRYALIPLALAALLSALPASAQRAARVKVDAVTREPLTQTMPILGRFVAREQGVVAAAVDGPVDAVHAHVGQRVSAGQLLVQLNGEMRAATLAQRKAERSMHDARLEAATAQLQITTDDMRRLEKLKGSAAFPRKQYEDQRHQVVRYTSELKEAQSARQRTEAEMRAANIALSRTQVVAPYGGIVSERHVSAGAYVRLGDPVVTLINDTELEIEAEVPGNRIGGLHPGAKVSMELDGKAALTATVRAVIPNENPTTRTRQVRLHPEFETSAMALAINQSATVHVPIGASREVVSVHKDAVINRRGQAMVYVVLEGKAAIRPVELGEAVGARLEVLNGLKVGDMVVVRGNERLRPGQPVAFGPPGKGRPPPGKGGKPASGGAKPASAGAKS